jgi:hypothetical protein
MRNMEKATNVIQFPFKGNYQNTLNQDTVVSSVNQIKHHHIDETLAVIIPQIFNNIELAGFHIIPEFEEIDNEYIKDCALAIEAIRSVLCKFHGIKHPFQQVSDSVFENEGEGVLKIAKTLMLELEPEEIFEEDSES